MSPDDNLPLVNCDFVEGLLSQYPGRADRMGADDFAKTLIAFSRMCERWADKHLGPAPDFPNLAPPSLYTLSREQAEALSKAFKDMAREERGE